MKKPHYNTLRYRKRRKKLIEYLGGSCECGSTKNLQFHHIDPSEKNFEVSREITRPWVEVIEEVKKCVLRCSDCHKKDHEGKHGMGFYTRKKCRCEICKTAWNTYHSEYKKRQKENALLAQSGRAPPL